ncbi:unnamed protein product [Linum trigynum]|uniref:Uncharacterized protein n=1 Tax=Linum trigynum TaxID=586398 RepID=A0AAV2DHT9_9ROSI
MALNLLNCRIQSRPPPPLPPHHGSFHHHPHHLATVLSSTFKPVLRDLQQLNIIPQKIDHDQIKKAPGKLLDAFVDSVFQFLDQPLLPSQSNFAPVDELKEAVRVTAVEGTIPDDFSEGVYIRNGPNPMFGGLKSTRSMLGRTSHIWVEGEGMLHVLYFQKRSSDGEWSVFYNNRHVETETYKMEKDRAKPSFLPAIEGHSSAILAAYLFNLMRFGKVNKYISNTNVVEHGGKFYAVAENHAAQEFDIVTLDTIGDWDVNGTWNRPFTAHPKRVPGTGELVIFGVQASKPFVELGVISADGERLLHKVDLNLSRCTLCHDVGITERYNVFMDFPLTIDVNRLIRGGPLIKYTKEDYARIGVMPRYGNTDSIRWFDVTPNCTFHIVNCFEDGNEVVVRGCRALDSIIPGPELGENKFDWFSRRFRREADNEGSGTCSSSSSEDGSLFTRCYEWRLNLETGEVKERNLTGKTEASMDFPMIHPDFTGLPNRFGYTQTIDSEASSSSGMTKYGGLAKLYFEEPAATNCDLRDDDQGKEAMIKVEYHEFEKNTFCTGAAFVPKMATAGSSSSCGEEDDGWVITFVHNEDTDTSMVYIIDAKKLSSEPVAKIALPCRVPYGFHGAFMPMSLPLM